MRSAAARQSAGAVRAAGGIGHVDRSLDPLGAKFNGSSTLSGEQVMSWIELRLSVSQTISCQICSCQACSCQACLAWLSCPDIIPPLRKCALGVRPAGKLHRVGQNATMKKGFAHMADGTK